MQIPPFARGRRSQMNNVALLMMYFKDFYHAMHVILKRDASELWFYQDTLLPVLASFEFVRSGANKERKMRQYQDGIRVCFKLFQLIVEFGRTQGLFDFISECIPKINEGRAELLINDKMKVDDGRYPEALRRKRLTEYKILYESCVRYSVIPFIWCMDTIDAFELGSNATVGNSASYFRNNVSFHTKRLLEPSKPIPSDLCLSPLARGLDEHWRNAIAHENIEHRDNGALLIDADPRNHNRPPWEYFATDEEIVSKIEELQVTHHFQVTACSLFGFEFEAKIDWSTHQAWRTEKELVNLLAIRVELLNLAMHAPPEIDEKQITLNLRKQDGFDSPSSMFWGGASSRGCMDFPPFNIERQIFELAKYCAAINVPQQYLEAHLFSFDDKGEGLFRADIAAAGKRPFTTVDISSVVTRG